MQDSSVRFGRNKAEYQSRCEQCGHPYRAGSWIAFDNWSTPVRKLCIKCADFEVSEGRGTYKNGSNAKAPAGAEALRTDLDAVRDTRSASSQSITPASGLTRAQVEDIFESMFGPVGEQISRDVEKLEARVKYLETQLAQKEDRIQNLELQVALTHFAATGEELAVPSPPTNNVVRS